MSTFLYFKPDHDKPVTLEDVRAWGLGYAFDSGPQRSPISGRTPTGAPGQLFCDKDRIGEQRFAYLNEQQQTWRQMPNSDIWMGYDNESKPTPSDLVRNPSLTSEEVELCDGQAWLIPKVRIFSDTKGLRCALPVAADLNEKGEWVLGQVRSDMQELNRLAERLVEAMFEALAGDLQLKLSATELLDIVSAMLTANYHISRTEIAMLKLLGDDPCLMRCCQAAVEFETALEWILKKNSEPVPADSVG